MQTPRLVELFEPFTFLRDPGRSNARHLLFDIFVIALCGVISGAEGWEDIEDYGHAQAEWFDQFLALPHGIPSHDTFARVFSRLNPDDVTHRFTGRSQASTFIGNGFTIHGRVGASARCIAPSRVAW